MTAAPDPRTPDAARGEVTVVEEWGYQWPDGEHVEDGIHAYPHPSFVLAGPAIETHRVMGARIFRRTRTVYADTVTEWEEVDD